MLRWEREREREREREYLIWKKNTNCSIDRGYFNDRFIYLIINRVKVTEIASYISNVCVYMEVS